MQTLKKLARWIAPSLTLAMVATGAAAQTAAATPLTLKVYNADAGSFHVNAVVVSGSRPTCWTAARR